MNRTLNVVRMQLVNRQTFVWTPLIILGAALAISLGIWAILYANGVREPMYGGGAQAPLWYFVAVGVQALTRTFPFSQAMSVTRREFYAGTLLTAALTAAVLAAVFVIGGAIEHATGGWGVGGYFFALDWLWQAGPLMAFAFFFAIAMLTFTIGFGSATIYKRFGSLWLTVVLVGLAVLLLLAVWLLSIARAWVPFFTAVATAGVGGLTLGLLAATAVIALVSFPILRRATP